jgi:hypothetical protein
MYAPRSNTFHSCQQPSLPARWIADVSAHIALGGLVQFLALDIHNVFIPNPRALSRGARE